jgi:hypothetical protein
MGGHALEISVKYLATRESVEYRGYEGDGIHEGSSIRTVEGGSRVVAHEKAISTADVLDSMYLIIMPKLYKSPQTSVVQSVDPVRNLACPTVPMNFVGQHPYFWDDEKNLKNQKSPYQPMRREHVLYNLDHLIPNWRLLTVCTRQRYIYFLCSEIDDNSKISQK